MVGALRTLSAAWARPRSVATARKPCGVRRDARLLGFAPAVTLAIFLGPVIAGALGTLAPAFGFLPVIGAATPSLEPFRALLAEPALPSALRLTLVSGLGGTLLALALTILFLASFQGARWFDRMRRALAPALAAPHVAVALALLFLLAPSGWLLRLISPWATGFDRPPDWATAPDEYGLALMVGLAAKETAFLTLMAISALGQIRAEESVRVARSMGYGRIGAWMRVVLPQLWPQIRLPFYAALAFSLSVVDMAAILAPASPPPLAGLLMRWFNDPDLSRRLVASAGAVLQIGVVLGAIGAAYAIERGLGAIGAGRLRAGRRWPGARTESAIRAAATTLAVLFGVVFLVGLLVTALWSFAGPWRFPDALPAAVNLRGWERALPAMAEPFLNGLVAALASATIALGLAMACLEREARMGGGAEARKTALTLVYLPLIAPQIGFLFGVQILFAALRIDGGMIGVVWAHLIFVLPYAFLSLADPWRAVDPRLERSARALGAGPWRAFFRAKLPVALRPALTTFAVAAAVSFGQYLPTIFAGGGRVPTLTTEAVALAAGGDRRVLAAFVFVQALAPLALFAAATAIPAWRARNRRGLRVGA